jgi:hypothetical protein
MYFAYRGCLGEFLKEDPNAIIGRLHQSVAEDGFSRLWNTQTSAWREEVAWLQTACRQLIAATEKAIGWTILLEYEIARRGRRIDAVLLTNRAIVVLEFKVGLQAADSSSRWQVYEYALDLRDFHGDSGHHLIVPIVVPTGSSAGSCTPPVVAGNHLTATPVHEVIECPPEQLAATILAVDAGLSDSSSPPIDHQSWCTADYRPSLNIIEAAERVFAGHEVREISHATATNLSCTVDAVIRCITEAQRNCQHVVCFVTGVPGAGKTLAGLSAVHDPALREDARPAAVFLSGNGPLVKIVRAALVRDLRRRSPKSTDGARQVATFIQNVHSFLGYYAFKAPEQVPPEHVVIFDEAQRAWDGKQMALKKRGDKSEAALMLEVMARCPDWSVIVALVGFGQEIHQGEAGLQEWGRAITGMSPNWSVVASPLVLDSSSDEGESGCLFPVDVPLPDSIERNRDLHLAVSIRSHRARMVSQWVKFVLEGNSQAAAELFAGTSEFPVVVTRDLADARAWLRAHSDGGAHYSGCSGLLASSGALRLRAYGLEVSSGFRHGYPYEDWFLRTSHDVRSSSSLEVAATEFECQGLEVDWAGVCWGDDMVFDPEARRWDTCRFVGSRWVSVVRPAARRFILNKYRVLLTRARRGFVVWVPPGSADDPTRKPHRLDATAEFLLNCGITPI